MGEFAHDHLATLPAEVDAELWLMTEKRAGGISDPLAAIVARRTGGAEVPADLNDLINAGVAFAAYVITNTLRSLRIRRNLRRTAAEIYVPPEEETDQ